MKSRENSIYWGSGHAIDIIHIEDAVEAAVKAAFSNSEGIINIGSGKSVSLVGFNRMLRRVFTADADKIKIKTKKGLGTGQNLFLDIGRAKRELKFFPRHSLIEMLHELKKKKTEGLYN